MKYSETCLKWQSSITRWVLCSDNCHCAKKPVTTMLTYPWKCTVLHCNHLGNTWKPLVLMTWHFDYCPSASEGDNQSVGSSAPVVSRCSPGGYNVKLYISRGRLAWWLLAFLCCVTSIDVVWASSLIKADTLSLHLNFITWSYVLRHIIFVWHMICFLDKRAASSWTVLLWGRLDDYLCFSDNC